MPGPEHVSNRIDGSVSGPVVQARDIGEIHFHGDGTREAAHSGQGRAGVRPDWALSEVTDPFSLEVHRAIEAGSRIADFPVLPAYVHRDHDRLLGEVVARAVGGVSQIVVLVGGSSTGKTRACWEALKPLRSVDQEWRLWHPIDPTHAEATLAGLAQIEPHTVVWLNEAQFHLADPALGERVAAGLRAVLRDPRRAPVLVLGTSWPGYWATLTTPSTDGAHDPHAQARALLAGHDLPVAETFTGTDLEALALEATDDPRLKYAAERAEQGQITQYLAGAPALLERYRTAPVPARALITAAMDARRLGHSVALPRALLAAAAEGSLTDDQYDLLEDDWLERSLAYTAKPLHGVRGPLTRIRPHPGRPEPAQPHYRLADYLEQHALTTRRITPTPPALWNALIDHATSADHKTLAHAAASRGLRRIGARLYAGAAEAGDHLAASSVASLLLEAELIQEAVIWFRRAGDSRGLTEADRLANDATREETAITWLEINATRRGTVAEEMQHLAPLLKKTGTIKKTIEKFQTRAEAGDHDGPWVTARLLEELGQVEEAITWYRRAAEAEDPRALPSAAWMLRKTGRTEESTRLRRFGWEPDGSIAEPWVILPNP
ncbi:hypothetical protein [Amycolatopsis sp.]|jgi:TPR repeat protein|uniref:hypothetical protein n=1 Tax=Amycolatopsis sp. TaxID=37632 RepID=UPI002E09E801|nr:hypothetical protein [Amycolatopsis sp.]